MIPINYFYENVDRWTTLPAGDYRQSIRYLMSLKDEDFMTHYNNYIVFWEKERSWEYEKYTEMFSTRNVVEIGSGMGYDGIKYSSKCESYTYCDINEIQLQFVNRVVELYGNKECKYEFYHIQDPLNIQLKEKKYNAIYSHGVLHHVPFEIAKQEISEFSKFMEKGALAVILMYPEERWVAAGRPSFKDFGNWTDGGCPWAEYYNEDKMCELFDDDWNLDDWVKWGVNNIEFVNYELTKVN
jgi:hypothetical protein